MPLHKLMDIPSFWPYKIFLQITKLNQQRNYTRKKEVGREASISLDGVRDRNIMQLKKLNLPLFPVRYNDKYYSDAPASADFIKLAHYSDICVGATTRRPSKEEVGGQVR